MKITLELSGGLDLCFGGEKVIDITLEGKDEINMGELINEIALHHIKKKPEFFVGNDKQLRAGILVLINDADWELDGKEDARIEHKDKISFISTLHGG